MGAIGVTGTSAANTLAARSDLVLAVGARLGDFATGSRALFGDAKLVQLKRRVLRCRQAWRACLVADADAGLEALERGLKGWKAPAAWTAEAGRLMRAWNRQADSITAPTKAQTDRRASAGRGEQRPAEERRRGLRGGRLAGRAAQAVARHRLDQLSPRVRLLVHGLRDRRRPGREARASAPRSVRAGGATAAT
jgi:3D-(3,5/4)-trihydroxycyclohexane-1,2-dione acylhydrolase (decyclizing)